LKSTALALCLLAGSSCTAGPQAEQRDAPQEDRTMIQAPITRAYELLRQGAGSEAVALALGEVGLLGLQGHLRAQDYAIAADIEALAADPRPEVRRGALDLLGLFVMDYHVNRSAEAGPEAAAAESATRTALRLMQDPDAEVRLAAVRALEFVREARLIEPMLGLLSDPSADVRFQALMSLARLHELDGEGRIRQSAAGLLEDPSPQVRKAASLLTAKPGP
jgi:HEAT repeat protein